MNGSTSNGTNQSKRPITPLGWVGAVIMGALASVAMSTSCKVNDGGDSEGSGATEPPPPACECSGEFWYARCACNDGSKRTTCQTEEGCAAWCIDPNESTIKDGEAGWLVISCSTYPDEGNCTNWAPQSHVSLSGGVRYIDDVWLASLFANPSPLWSCDNATLDDINGGGFKVLLANSGELLYELGLQNNDIPYTLNGMPLLTVQDGFDAIDALYNNGVTSYTLVVHRGSTTVTKYYVIN